VSVAYDKLVALLTRFDEDAFVALANRGLFRRAQKESEKLAPQLLADDDATVSVRVGEHTIVFDARGPAHAKCTCPSITVCQHILAASIWLQQTHSSQSAAAPTSATSLAASPLLAATNETGDKTNAATIPPSSAQSTATDLLTPLREELLALPLAALTKYAGKPGYRWAWQFVNDLEIETSFTIAGEKNLVLGFARPRITFRFMGGGLDGLIADSDVAQLNRYRVAAVLALRVACGEATVAPEDSKAGATGALDLGKDHQLAESADDNLKSSRQKLRASAVQLITECIALGLSHLSDGIEQRFATLAVWSQGAEYYRLALLLRRIADHVEQLLERAGNADEHRLLDELTIAFGLVSALEIADQSGLTPQHLVGAARSRYEDVGTIELIGLGAQAWRSPAGYIGLTMLFWSPRDQAFLSCSDARPENQRGFNPVARYKAAGPWSGLGAPELLTGSTFTLTRASTNAIGRLSANAHTSLANIRSGSAAQIRETLNTFHSWTTLAEVLAQHKQSVLASAQPMKDWAVIAPASFGTAHFDKVTQTLNWPVFDQDDNIIVLELAFDDFSAHAIKRVEVMTQNQLDAGVLVVARFRRSAHGLIGEPLSLIRNEDKTNKTAVDALHFDAPEKASVVSKWLDELLAVTARTNVVNEYTNPLTPSRPTVLGEFHSALQRMAERGLTTHTPSQDVSATPLEGWKTRLDASGWNVFSHALSPIAASEHTSHALLRANYLYLQYQRMTNDSAVMQQVLYDFT
jgi:hypothetical protein